MDAAFTDAPRNKEAQDSRLMDRLWKGRHCRAGTLDHSHRWRGELIVERGAPAKSMRVAGAEFESRRYAWIRPSRIASRQSSTRS